jgi:hypothetical protein
LMLLSKIFPEPCMFLLLHCLGTILALTCLASCQLSCSPPPSLGSSGRHHSTPSAALRRPLCHSVPWPNSFIIRVRSRDKVVAVSLFKACKVADAMPDSLHRRGTRPANGHCPRGWTSDLFSFQPSPELGGSPGYTPGDCLTCWVYSTTFVQCLYLSCYLSESKPVLSYLLLHLLPQ